MIKRHNQGTKARNLRIVYKHVSKELVTYTRKRILSYRLFFQKMPLVWELLL